MTLEEWFAKFFASEYLNVQDPTAWREQAKAELEAILNPKPAEET